MYYYNQTFVDDLPSDVREWCIEHDAHIEERKEEDQVFEEAEGKSVTQKGKTYYTIKVNEYDGPTEGFHIGQIFHGTYPPEAAVWCNENNAIIEQKGRDFIISEPPAPTEEEKAQRIRAERDRRMRDTLWLSDRHRSQKDAGLKTTLTDDQYRELGAYQQKLRDVPQQAGFPWDGDPNNPLIDWPLTPDFIPEPRRK